MDVKSLYALSFFVLALGVLLAMQRGACLPDLRSGARGLSGFIREGWIFAVGRLSTPAFDHLDKPMLSWLASPAIAGIYGAANRVIEAGLLPLSALLGAAYRRHFQAGDKGLAESHSFVFRMLPLSFATSALSALAIWLCAPILPVVLGADYEQVVGTVRLLAVLLLLQGLLGPIADALTERRAPTGVIMQTSSSSCTAATLANIAAFFGDPLTERDAAALLGTPP